MASEQFEAFKKKYTGRFHKSISGDAVFNSLKNIGTDKLEALLDDPIFIDFFEVHIQGDADEQLCTIGKFSHSLFLLIATERDQRDQEEKFSKEDVIKIICLIDAHYQIDKRDWVYSQFKGLKQFEEEFQSIRSIISPKIPDKIENIDNYINYKTNLINSKKNSPDSLTIKLDSELTLQLEDIDKSLGKIIHEDTSYKKRSEGKNIIVSKYVDTINCKSNFEDVFTVSAMEIKAIKPSNDLDTYIIMLKAAITAYKGKSLEIYLPENFKPEERKKVEEAINTVRSDMTKAGEKFPNITGLENTPKNVSNSQEPENPETSLTL